MCRVAIDRFAKTADEKDWKLQLVSGTNVIILGLTGINHASPSYHLMIFFDAFLRSFGITLILVLGLMKVMTSYYAYRAMHNERIESKQPLTQPVT
jgi:hypothetical membrane protein